MVVGRTKPIPGTAILLGCVRKLAQHKQAVMVDHVDARGPRSSAPDGPTAGADPETRGVKYGFGIN